MILDTSAILAILLREPGWERLVEKVGQAPAVGVGGPTLTEAGIVLAGRLGPAGISVLARFVQETGASVVPFGARHWEAAVDAFDRYGQTTRAGGLNFGDCLTYATASLAGQPLLAMGEDFARTDLELA